MQELKMTRSAIGPLMAASIAGALALASPAVAKTAKECRAEWSANKAANQAKGVTEKAYVDQCRAADATPKAAAKDTPKETAKDKKAAAKETKEKAAAKDAKTAAPAGEKTAKQCADEWRANKAANQAAKITEKAYVADCRSGKTAMMPPAAAPAPTPAAKSEPAPSRPTKSQEASTPPPTAPAPASSKSAATTAAAPASGKPEAANQYAAESQAKSHCPSGLVVWANLDSKIYHFSGHNDYGHTKQGAYMCEADAEAQGMRAAKNEKHP
jgi:hypothetical protein